MSTDTCEVVEIRYLPENADRLWSGNQVTFESLVLIFPIYNGIHSKFKNGRKLKK